MRRVKYLIAVAIYCPECLRFRFQPGHLRHCRKRRRFVRTEVAV